MIYNISYKCTTQLFGYSFEDYIRLNAHSHSSLKRMKDGFVPHFQKTDKMRIGTIVDNIITNNSIGVDITDELYPIAKDIAVCMKSQIGEGALKNLTFQNTYTSTLENEGFYLQVKGRNDAELKRLAVIDFKVTDKAKDVSDCIKLVEFMGYDNQIYHYSRQARVENRFLFIHSRKAKKTFFLKRLTTQLSIDLVENWWINKIFEHGENLF